MRTISSRVTRRFLHLGSLVCAITGAAGGARAQAPVPVPAPAEPSPSPAPAEPAAPCDVAVKIHVVDAASHNAVAGATVSINGEVVALTDDNGIYRLEGVCRGLLALEVGRVDFESFSTTLAVTGNVSVEIALINGGDEVIVIESEKRRALDTRATSVVDGEALERLRGRGFSDTLAEVPGVSQLRSASGMSKPIVRGQFGRRLRILVDSIQHRSQDWGIDHAPEIDPFMADSITVVRGAAGVRYGPDAIGGAVLVDSPPLLREPGEKGELHLIVADRRGGNMAARLGGATKVSSSLVAWQLDASLKRLQAASTPLYALDNTGSLEWSGGATVGYRSGNRDVRLSYRHYQAQLGVCTCLRIESSEDFFAQLERDRPADADLYEADFDIDRPRQAVAHDLAIARGRWRLDDIGTLSATYAFQYDHREEFDVVRTATGPQFDFLLSTHDLDVELDHEPLHLSDHLHARGSLGAVAMVQVHGFGGLSLVPDHRARSLGVFAIERLLGHDFEIEAGLRYDIVSREADLERRDFQRLVRSGQLAADACGGDAGTDPVTCSSLFHMVSATVGGLYQITSEWSAKVNLSTASRPPSPDEQYLNGTAPSFPVLGLGKPDLDPETTYASSLSTSFAGDHLALEASIYANYIAGYIDFAPALDDMGQPIFDVLIRGSFPRFVTRPVNAVFYGLDGGVTYKPFAALELGAQLAMVRAKNVSDDSFLVFVPPDRARATARLTRESFAGLEKAYVSAAVTYVARQGRFDRAADLAPPPDAYATLDAELGVEDRLGEQTIKGALVASNLTNARYRDYTSLLRYFADQPGWQLLMRVSVIID